MQLLEHIAVGQAGPLKAITGQTTSATPGNRTTHAHGLVDARGNAVTPTVAFGVPTHADADSVVSTATGAIHVTLIDATNVKVKSGGTSVGFTLYVG